MDESTQTKRCRLCGAQKPLDEFHRQQSTPDGRRAECKPCRREYRMALYRLTDEDRAEKQQQAKAKLRELRKKCTRCHEVKLKAEFNSQPRNKDGRSAHCKECEREYQRAYAIKNADRLRASAKAYYEATKATRAERSRAYRQENAARLARRFDARYAFASLSGVQTCSKCQRTLMVYSFARDGQAGNGRAYWCKDCANAARRVLYLKNRERELEKGRKWREENKELHKQLTRAWAARNKPRAAATRRRWVAANLERHQETRRNWLLANPDYYRTWNEENPDRLREAARKYRLNNLEKYAEQTSRRRALELDRTVGEIDLDALWTGQCSLCGKPIDWDTKWPDPFSKSLDHTIPLARGGTHEQANLTYAHLLCNMRKGDRLP